MGFQFINTLRSSVNFSLSTKRVGFLQPSGRASSVQESASINFSLYTKKSDFSTLVAGLHLFKNLLLSAYHSPPRKIEFLHPSGRTSSVNFSLGSYGQFREER